MRSLTPHSPSPGLFGVVCKEMCLRPIESMLPPVSEFPCSDWCALDSSQWVNHNVGLEKGMGCPVRALTLSLGCHPSEELSASLWEGNLLLEADG